MNKMKLFIPRNPILMVSMFSFLLLGTISCSKKMPFLNSSVVPASYGDVQIKTDKNNNQSIKISIVNLAEPERLTPPKKMYMVWMETDETFIKNLGQIKTSNGTFSKALKATFKTVTTFKPTKIFITAEDDENTTYPAEIRVLTTDKFNK